MKKLVLAAFVLSAVVLTGCGEKEAEKAANVAEEALKEVNYEALTDAEMKELPLLGEEDLSSYVELGDYKGLEVSAAITEPTEAEIQQKIDNNMEALTDRVEVKEDRPVQEGDIVNIDYIGKKDGVAFDSGTAEGYDLEIGSGQFISGFEDGLIGAKKGETRDLNLTFPEQYHSEDLAGAEVVFTVTVNTIYEETVPELTDEVANGLNPECKTVAEYKEAIRQGLIESKKEAALTSAKNELIAKATSNATIKEIPEWIIRLRMQSLRSNIESYAAANGVSYEQFVEMAMESSVEEFEKQAVNYAEEDAKQSLVAFAIAKKEGLLMSQQEIEEELGAYLTSVQSPEDVKDFALSLEGRSYGEYLQLQKVTEWLYDNAKVTE